MIKALSLAAALALLPLSASVAAEARGPSEDALEAAADVFEARMDEFGARAGVIAEDSSLTGDQREARIHALWAEYQPDLNRFTALASQVAPEIAREALADIDVEAIVAEAVKAVEESGALTAAGGIAANGAWASNDPEHLQTMGLVVQYALGEAADAVDQVQDATVEAVDEAVADTADGEGAPPPPPPAPAAR